MPRAAHGNSNAARDFIELVAFAGLAFVVALLVRAYVAEPFIIPSASMTDTLMVGDRLVGEKLTYRSSSPQAGDIVTFKDPDDPSLTLIKRVVATEGQTVNLVDGKVYVDGTELSEDYTDGKPSYPLPAQSSLLSSAITYPYTVPAGHIWVMGDNRTNSQDSRYFGAIPVSNVTSKAVFVFWPPEHVGTI